MLVHVQVVLEVVVEVEHLIDLLVLVFAKGWNGHQQT
jgi:hypothetical protein